MALQFNTSQSQYFPISSTSSSPQNPLEAVKIEHNRATIEKIKNFIAQGFKVCVFIGRGPAEPLPPPSNPNEIWVSLDPSLRSPEELPADRLHLILSCNDNAEMASIQHLFSEVVVDQSTMKFFNPGIIDRMIPLLTQEAESTLIFESSFQFNKESSELDVWKFDHIQLTIPKKKNDQYYKERDDCLTNFLQEIGGKDNLASNTLYQEFLEGIDLSKFRRVPRPDQLLDGFLVWLSDKKGIQPPSAKYIPLARQKTVDYLKTLCDHVELKLDTPYPCWTRYRTDHDDFFVAKGPKKTKQ